jgi:predicted secreted protein
MVLTSGIAVGVLALGAGATWAAAAQDSTSPVVPRSLSAPTTSTPIPSTTEMPDPGAAGIVDLHGPDGLPSEVAVKVGGLLVVHLKEQAGSTGYSWTTQEVPTVLRPVNDQVISRPSPSGMTGVPDEHVFTFAVTEAGTGQLSFALLRPWLPNNPAQTVSLTVTAES